MRCPEDCVECGIVRTRNWFCPSPDRLVARSQSTTRTVHENIALLLELKHAKQAAQKKK